MPTTPRYLKSVLSVALPMASLLAGPTPVPARAAQNKATTPAPRKSPDITVSDKQLKQIAAVGAEIDYRSDDMLEDYFRIIPLDGPRPPDATGAQYYNLVRSLRDKAHIPVTDVVLYNGYLESPFAMSVGNRAFITLSQKTPDMTEVGHELAHILLHHGLNPLLMKRSDLKNAIRTMASLNRLVEKLMDTLEVSSDEKTALSAIKEREIDKQLNVASALIYAFPSLSELKSEFEKSDPALQPLLDLPYDSQGAKKMAQSIIRQFQKSSFVNRRHELEADKAGNKITCMPGAASEYWRGQMENDIILDIFKDAGILNHPFFATRLAWSEWFKKNPPKECKMPARR